MQVDFSDGVGESVESYCSGWVSPHGKVEISENLRILFPDRDRR